MPVRSALLPAAFAILIGASDWELMRRLSFRREAWDDPLYWQLGVPVMLLAALLMGMLWRERPWRWAVCLVLGQMAWALALGHDGVPNLLPLGLTMFVILGVPLLLAAYAGRWIGEKAFA